MEGSSNGQSSGMNPNEKIPTPPPLLQPNGGVPSIFLGPVNSSNNSMSAAEGNPNSVQTSAWSSAGVEMQRGRSPPSSSGAGTSDSYKMKACASTQCGNSNTGSGGHEGLSSNMQVIGAGCQPPIQNRMYPPPLMQQTQIAMPIRSMHQHHHHHHHHHGVPGQCHPHHPQQSTMTVTPHLERIMHGGSSAVAVAAAQQMRSMVMNHYPPNSTGYPHQSSAPTASNYYPQAVTTASGNGSFMEYNHPHNPHHHHHHGHGITAAAAAAVQYAHQQQQHHQRMVSSAAASLSPYRQIPVHHPQQKVISSSQAAAAYQNMYQQHHYNQYLHHHHGMVASHSHPHHQNGPGTSTSGVIQPRVLGIPINNLQQQQQQAYVNRAGQHIPHLHQQHHNHGYSSTCQPPLVSNYAGASQQQHQAQHQQQLVNQMVGPGSAVAPNITGQLLDLNNNSTNNKTMGCCSDVPGIKPASKKSSSEALIANQKSLQNSSLKISSIKISTASPEKSVKLKATRSVTKLRDRQPRLVVGQKKKSAGSIATTGSSRKLKSLKALSAAVSSAVAGENLHPSSKRLTSSLVETEGNGDAKRSRKVAKNDDVVVNPSASDASAEESSEKRPAVGKDEPVGELNRPISDNYFLDKQNEDEDEYVPTAEEIQKYLERLNSCNNLNIPPYFAYSVFHGKLSKKNNPPSSKNNSSSATTAEGTYSTTTTTTSSCTTILYHHYNQQQEFNFTTYCNWDSPALAAEEEWKNFQDDMAVLEAYFPLASTMEQSERAEKLDTIYTYEGQVKLMNSSPPTATACTVVGGDQISPPCNCVQDTATCSCCYNYLTGMMPSSMGSPEDCGNSSFVGDASPQYVMDPPFHHLPQPHFVSTPLSSRRTYPSGGTHFYDEENGYYYKESSSGSRHRVGARKRSSSYPSRKSGRRSSGSRDHLKSETESFLDELISTANDEKSKQRNSSGEVLAPEIQCEVDFPSLESSAAVPYSKRQLKKGKAEESISSRDEYQGSSSTSTEESESNSSPCSSSSQSAHNTSSDGDFDGGSEITLVDTGRVANHCMSSKTNHSMLLPPACGHFEDEPCCSEPEHLWDAFRGDELVSMQSETLGPTLLGGASCIPVASLSHLISHCTCRRVDALCPTRPPPGFEHLARPAFPIELYDPSLLGNLIGSQLPREVLASLDSSAMSKKQFDEMEALLKSLTCCEKHAVDKILHSRRTSISSSTDEDEPPEDADDDWESLEKAIKSVLNEWTEELGFRKRMQDILFTLNLHDSYGGCCNNMQFEQAEQENITSNFDSRSSLLESVTTADDAEESDSII